MNNILKEKIENAIANVMHPAINLSLTTLGIAKEIKISDKKVEVTFAFPSPIFPLATN